MCNGKTMYCVIGEKILGCEVKKKEELSSICKVGSSKKEQSIANNRLFKTEEEAAQFIKKRKINKMNENKQVAHAVEVCKALYEKLYEETGIEVRTIDRQWTVNAAEKHIMKLKRTLLDKPETHDKNVSKSFGIAPNPKKEKQRFSPKRVSKSGDSRDKASRNKDSEKDYSEKSYSDKKYSDRNKADGNRYDRSDSKKRTGQTKDYSKNNTRNNAQGSSQSNAKGSMKNNFKNNTPKNNTSRKYTNK